VFTCERRPDIHKYSVIVETSVRPVSLNTMPKKKDYQDMLQQEQENKETMERERIEEEERKRDELAAAQQMRETATNASYARYATQRSHGYL
jgi:hypothetical protein